MQRLSAKSEVMVVRGPSKKLPNAQLSSKFEVPKVTQAMQETLDWGGVIPKDYILTTTY